MSRKNRGRIRHEHRQGVLVTISEQYDRSSKALFTIGDGSMRMELNVQGGKSKQVGRGPLDKAAVEWALLDWVAQSKVLLDRVALGAASLDWGAQNRVLLDKAVLRWVLLGWAA